MPVATLGDVQKHWILGVATKLCHECQTDWLRVAGLSGSLAADQIVVHTLILCPE